MLVFGLVMEVSYRLEMSLQEMLRDPDAYVTAGCLLGLGAAFILGRRSRFRQAALILAVVTEVGAFLMAMPLSSPDAPVMLMYLVIPVLLCSIFLSIRVTALLIVINTAAMMLAGLLLPDVILEDLPLLSVLLISLLMLFAAEYRRVLERERRAVLEASEERFRYLATHDVLTGLTNRFLFDDRLETAISRARRNGRHFAVLFLDLDNFKSVNDAFTQSTGDLILKQASDRLRETLRETDTITRRGGDEFSILLEGIPNPLVVTTVVEKLLAAMREPYFVLDREIFVTTSIGISLYPDNGLTPENLLKHADTALVNAKSAGRNTYALYSGEISQRAMHRISLGSRLRYALERQELSLEFQPLVDTSRERVTGFEALLRWRLPESGMVPPSEFIPIAEETGMILPIGEWVLREACRTLAEWRDAGFGDLRVSVNVSERQLASGTLPELVAGVLDEFRLVPDNLELELTENILFQDLDESVQLLQRLKETGVRLAVDDFGTGFLTLRHLARFPIDTIKIDRSFTPAVTGGSRDRAVIVGIMTIAQQLGISTVAEGVETAEQLQAYRELGCGIIQGWYYSRALPSRFCVDYLRERNGT